MVGGDPYYLPAYTMISRVARIHMRKSSSPPAHVLCVEQAAMSMLDVARSHSAPVQCSLLPGGKGAVNVSLGAFAQAYFTWLHPSSTPKEKSLASDCGTGDSESNEFFLERLRLMRNVSSAGSSPSSSGSPSSSPPPTIMLDVGAGAGGFALLASQHPELRVYAFEPNPESANELRRNIWLNGLEERVMVSEVCVGGEDGVREATLMQNPSGVVSGRWVAPPLARQF